jgi:hypothetical protein
VPEVSWSRHPASSLNWDSREWSCSDLRSSFAPSREAAKCSSPLWFHCFCRDGSPSVRETGKRDGCRVANHGPIGDSWPIAFFGHPRGHRVFIETRCPKAHTAYYGVRYSPSIPSVSAIQLLTAKNDPQEETTVCPRRSSGLRFHTLGIEMRSFLPNRQSDGRNLACQGETSHRRLHSLSE